MGSEKTPYRDGGRTSWRYSEGQRARVERDGINPKKPQKRTFGPGGRGLVDDVCRNCGEPIKRLEEAWISSTYRRLCCGKCRQAAVMAAIKRMEARETRRERPKHRGPYAVRCLRCSWTGKVASRYGAFVCGKDPRHPVVAE